MPVSPPLNTTESGTATSVRPTNTLEFNGADFTVTGSGDKATISIDSTGTGAALTDTHIGFGNASNLLTGSANFTFVDESGGTGPTVQLTGDQPQIIIQDDTQATDYQSKLIQSGASLYQYSIDSGGTNNEMVRYAQAYIAFQRSMTPNVGIGTVPSSGVALHIKDDESDNDNVVLRIQDSSVDTVGDQVAIEGYWNSAQAGVIYFELRDTTTAASAIVMKASNDAGSLTEFVRIDGNAKAVTFNEQSEDVDFRVETANADSTLRIVGSTDNVGIGGIPDSTKLLHIIDDGTKAVTLSVESTDGDANVGPVIQFNRNSGSPADGDSLGALYWSFDDDGGGTNDAGFIKGYISDASAGSEDADFYWYANSNGSQINMLSIRGGIRAVEVNVNNADVDFIANGDTVAELIHLDASDDSVGIGGSPDSNTARLQVTDDGSKSYTILMESTDPDANAGPTFGMWRNSGSPAAGDDIGTIYFAGENDAGSRQNFAQIDAEMDDVASGGEDASINFRIQKASNLRKAFRIRYSEVVVNEDSDDINFRVESNANSNMFQVDAGQNKVVVGSPLDTTGATFQVPDNTISSYCNVNAMRADTPATMAMLNVDCQGQMWVHDSAIAQTIDLPLTVVKGQWFKFLSTGGDITVDPNSDGGTSNTLNGGTGALTRSTNNEIYTVIAIDSNKWIISNPA